MISEERRLGQGSLGSDHNLRKWDQISCGLRVYAALDSSSRHSTKKEIVLPPQTERSTKLRIAALLLVGIELWWSDCSQTQVV